jgi:hypothetical protein
MFVGYVRLGEDLIVPAMFRDQNQTPTDLDDLPTVRVYGPDGLVASASATASFLDSGTITGATNATPIVITSAGHGLTTGTLVTVADVGGNTAADGQFVVTRVDDDTFELDGSAGDGEYTEGGTWHLSGIYRLELAATEAAGFEAGLSYTAIVRGAMSLVEVASQFVFIVT